MKFLIIQFSPSSIYSPQHFILRRPQSVFFPCCEPFNVVQTVFQVYKLFECSSGILLSMLTTSLSRCFYVLQNILVVCTIQSRTSFFDFSNFETEAGHHYWLLVPYRLTPYMFSQPWYRIKYFTRNALTTQ